MTMGKLTVVLLIVAYVMLMLTVHSLQEKGFVDPVFCEGNVQPEQCQ